MDGEQLAVVRNTAAGFVEAPARAGARIEHRALGTEVHRGGSTHRWLGGQLCGVSNRGVPSGRGRSHSTPICSHRRAGACWHRRVAARRVVAAAGEDGYERDDHDDERGPADVDDLLGLFRRHGLARDSDPGHGVPERRAGHALGIARVFGNSLVHGGCGRRSAGLSGRWCARLHVELTFAVRPRDTCPLALSPSIRCMSEADGRGSGTGAL